MPKKPNETTNNREYSRRRRELVSDFKKKPCADCATEYPSYVMDLDHRPGTEKKFTIALAYGVSLKRLLAELAKCDVVCANCHRERTHQRKLAASANGKGLGLLSLESRFESSCGPHLDVAQRDRAGVS